MSVRPVLLLRFDLHVQPVAEEAVGFDMERRPVAGDKLLAAFCAGFGDPSFANAAAVFVDAVSFRGICKRFILLVQRIDKRQDNAVC